MKDIKAYTSSLTAGQPDSSLSPQLKSLWYDGKGNWQRAHAQVDHLGDPASAWVHAYLHRKEGDIANADYWYRKAGKARPAISLAEEWRSLVAYFLNNEHSS